LVLEKRSFWLFGRTELNDAEPANDFAKSLWLTLA